jgi:hypothetical protein
VRLARIPVSLNQSLIRGIARKVVADNLQVAQDEELERVDVTAEEGALALIQGDLAADPAGVMEPSREEPHFALLAALEVPVGSQLLEVYLRDLSCDCHAQDHQGGKLRIGAVDPPPHRGYAHPHAYRF